MKSDAKRFHRFHFNYKFRKQHEKPISGEIKRKVFCLQIFSAEFLFLFLNIPSIRYIPINSMHWIFRILCCALLKWNSLKYSGQIEHSEHFIAVQERRKLTHRNKDMVKPNIQLKKSVKWKSMMKIFDYKNIANKNKQIETKFWNWNWFSIWSRNKLEWDCWAYYFHLDLFIIDIFVTYLVTLQVSYHRICIAERILICRRHFLQKNRYNADLFQSHEQMCATKASGIFRNYPNVFCELIWHPVNWLSIPIKVSTYITVSVSIKILALAIFRSILLKFNIIIKINKVKNK